MALTNDQITAQNFKDFYQQILPYLGKSGGGGSMNYSTDEQVVGTWIDGKPVYQKSFATTLTDHDQTDISMGASIDKYIDINVIQYSSGYFRPLTLITNDFTKYIKVSAANNDAGQYANTLYIRNTEPNYYNTNVIATVQYTKTTD